MPFRKVDAFPPLLPIREKSANWLHLDPESIQYWYNNNANTSLYVFLFKVAYYNAKCSKLRKLSMCISSQRSADPLQAGWAILKMFVLMWCWVNTRPVSPILILLHIYGREAQHLDHDGQVRHIADVGRSHHRNPPPPHIAMLFAHCLHTRVREKLRVYLSNLLKV